MPYGGGIPFGEPINLEEEGVERHSFSQCHPDDGLNEDFTGGSGVAADRFNSLGANHAYADGGCEAAEATLNWAKVTRDLCKDFDHVLRV